MSHRALSQALFHGTAAPIKTGEKILPATKGGGPSNWTDTGGERGQRSDEHAFATNQEKHAWYFAQTAAYNGDGHYGNRPRVYTVAPHRQMKPGAFHEELGEFIAPSFKVTGRQDIMPGQQGTLAGHGDEPFNWTPFHSTHQPGQANHPATPAPHTPTSHNVEARQRQDGALLKERTRKVPEQPTLPMSLEPGSNDDHQRAKHHILRELVNSGHAPAMVPDHELAKDESMDAWNRKRGRRTNFAKRDQPEISAGGAL